MGPRKRQQRRRDRSNVDVVRARIETLPAVAAVLQEVANGPFQQVAAVLVRLVTAVAHDGLHEPHLFVHLGHPIELRHDGDALVVHGPVGRDARDRPVRPRRAVLAVAEGQPGRREGDRREVGECAHNACQAAAQRVPCDDHGAVRTLREQVEDVRRDGFVVLRFALVLWRRSKSFV